MSLFYMEQLHGFVQMHKQNCSVNPQQIYLDHLYRNIQGLGSSQS